MDDDVVVLPESIKRTFRLFSFVTDEYKDAMISGAMLFLEDVALQYEDVGNITKTYIKVIIKIINQNNFISIPPPNVLLLLTSNGTIKTWHHAKVNPIITINFRIQPMIDSLSSGWEKYINI